eukprot:7403275-Pyramimonas_sp.AAC.2
MNETTWCMSFTLRVTRTRSITRADRCTKDWTFVREYANSARKQTNRRPASISIETCVHA